MVITLSDMMDTKQPDLHKWSLHMVIYKSNVFKALTS